MGLGESKSLDGSHWRKLTRFVLGLQTQHKSPGWPNDDKMRALQANIALELANAYCYLQ